MAYELTKQDIQEGSINPSKECIKLGVFGTYELWYDKKENKMVFYATDYHAGTLDLSKSGLEKMLAVLSNQIPVEDIRNK